MKEFKTPNEGKTLELYNEGNSVRVRWKEGGVLPEVLKGVWTDMEKAAQSINIYLNDIEPLHIQVKDKDGIYQKVKNQKKNPVEAS
jgi:hypothetical protein